MTYIVGLTGGIGSGKTVVSDHLGNLGVPIIDTDVIAREVVEAGQPTLQKLVDAFGESILLADGNLDREELRNIAFSNEANKAILDAITHPAIRDQTLKQIAEVNFPYCVVVVPLLAADSPFEAVMQRILVVTAEHQTKVERVMKRSNLTADEVEKIMATQLSDDQRREFADDIIANNGTIADAQNAAEELHKLYMQLSEEFS